MDDTPANPALLEGDELPAWPMEFAAPDEAAGKRLDAFLAKTFPQYSRAAVQRAIAAGQVKVEAEKPKPSLKLEAGWQIAIAEIETEREGPEPEDIPLDILYEDDWLVAVNKPAGMIVHPAKGHWSGTLAAALAFRFKQLSTTGGPTRPGIVHRLDRDTSGVIIVAKHDRAHEALAAQFKNRTTEKEYWAIVRGQPDRDADVIDRPIGPHPKIREQMAIRAGDPKSKEAVTTFEVVERFERFALLKVLPKTGRTHQIRVHLASIGLPILCDKLYGGSSTISRWQVEGGLINPFAKDFDSRRHKLHRRFGDILKRQALHARRITLGHPQTGERISFEAALPNDLADTIACLRNTKDTIR